MPDSSSEMSFRDSILNFWEKVFIERIERMKMTEHTFTILISILIGFLAGFGAIGVRFLIKLVQELSFGSGTNILEKAIQLPWYEKILIPLIGGAVVGPLIHFFAKEAKGHGVPEVMEAVVLRDGIIRPRVAIIKAIASSITIGTGGSAGREGPVVQIGSSIGSTIGQLLMVSGRRLRTFVACGAAAGIAAAFNAPIAGALFSVEIILGDFGLTFFSPIVISSVVATVISRHFMGNFAAFDVPAYRLVDPLELIFYLGLGIFCGFVALAFIKALYSLESFFDNLKLHDAVKPAVGGVLIGIMALWMPHIFGVGYESINLALNSNMAWSFLLLLTFAKILATSITLGSGGSGGVFAPSLFIGAMAGGFFGSVANIIAPDITATPGAYALVGMGAVVSGATHAPITAILIIFELTNDYKIILPLMISCIISTLLTSKLNKESIYTLKLALRGINIFKGKEVNVLRTLNVRDVIGEAEVIPADLSFSDLIDRITTSGSTIFYVTDKDEKFLGTIHLKALSGIIKDIENLKDILVARDLVEQSDLFLYPDDNLDHAMHIFGNSNVEEIPVLDPSGNRKMLGKVRENDIIETYNKEIFKIDTLTEISEGIGNIDRRRIESFTDEFNLIEINAPLTFVGKDLKELALRQRYGVQVFLVKKQMPDSKEGKYIDIVPKPDVVIEKNDILLLAGPQKVLLQLRNL